MRTEENEIETCDAPVVASQQIDPEALWLDQNISGEELIELDPLEETEDLLALAEQGLGVGESVLKQLTARSVPERLWQLTFKALKAARRKEQTDKAPVGFE